MASDTITLNELNIGQEAIIISFTDAALSLKLLDMGCLPGETIKIQRVAPFGDPIAIEVAGYMLSLRKAEATTIIVSPKMNT